MPLYNLNNYLPPLTFSSKTNKSSGIIVYIRSTLDCEIKNLSLKGVFDFVPVTLKDLSNSTYLIGNLYKYHTVSSPVFCKSLHAVLDKYLKYKIILTGDFNIDLIDQDVSKQLKYTLTKMNFQSGLSKDTITRLGNKGTQIDHVWTNIDLHKLYCRTLEPPIT